jgi:hypothetical protein
VGEWGEERVGVRRVGDIVKINYNSFNYYCDAITIDNQGNGTKYGTKY